ncbi:unnamed protein product [Aureobasidium uvarum]|uniref:Secreted protein n=1 Tax=Aureobasidium uvarum TaxID=2773716 RepID=A0A9N8KJB1_9PEZI|nr:unnamed protein product [Aureobasidium uvarum]
MDNGLLRSNTGLLLILMLNIWLPTNPPTTNNASSVGKSTSRFGDGMPNATPGLWRQESIALTSWVEILNLAES